MTMATRIDDIPVEPPPRWLRVIETLVLSLGLPAVGWLISPDDPLLLDMGLPWLLVAAPLLVGIRYGFAFGFSSALISLALIGVEAWWHTGQPLPHHDHALIHGVAVVLTGMLAGEMADTWQRRLRQLAAINHGQRIRLDEFVRHYHLLRVSHDQLAERLAANPFTLRDALHQLALQFRHLARDSADNPLDRHGNELLTFLAHHARIQQAVLIRLDSRHRPCADGMHTFGGRMALDLDDAMIRACLKERQMICQRATMDHNLPSGGSLLAVVPLIDVHGDIHALVAISEMPFIDFQRGQLHLLAVLGALLGDLLLDAQRGLQHPARAAMAPSLARWVNQARRNRLSSLLVTLTLPRPLAQAHGVEIVDLALDQLRALDQGWVTRSDSDEMRLHILMPLADARAATPYAERLWHCLETRLGMDIRQQGARLEHREIDGKDSTRALLAELEPKARRHAMA
ncbi:PelD GGDEF domain-containing protein [Halomonas urumqiensis]|uniref:PelD GGDEF domain-containing protein n=1 Tax=Halomonas urumqiensis TaxID=1684789 RepID=A0A2N7UK52_9GAMM|nr:PelD GGDEF domain-containing protein [Halomonas urumqiensis]PMR80813.1 hypothetical protein C1H70_07020 [Halomonas urumqiensis]PTB02770.1 hypothetical protein C6V82_09020 [Halomonas urumqiensis]GHE21272.1 pellicle/biofilm biosynthesis protein PelD [Halomonas urumqiensis]